MISRIIITDPKNTGHPWWPDVKWLKGVKELEFKPGVNIIVGPNGSGKSTVLNLIAKKLFAFQGSVQTVTRTGIHDAALDKTGVTIEHDGSPVAYADPGKQVGLAGGGFDDDFFMAGLQNTISKVSAGESGMRQTLPILEMLWGKDPVPTAVWKGWVQDKEKATIQALIGECPKRPWPTIILDEPTRSLSMPLDEGFWNNIVRHAQNNNVQVLVAAHSPFCMDVKDAHYIETEPHYRDKCLAALRRHFENPKAKP